ncbi:MAG: hypothetical protein IIW39_02800 [Clostridia bacterium]|nr:hypothetical protein [Clostridia bacterium]
MNNQQPNQQPNYQQPNQQPNYQQPNYQQPNYQQPNYQQPNYQQPNYQQPYAAPKKQGAGLNGLVDFIVKLLPILTLIFLCVGAAAFLYYFVMGIADSIGFGASFRNFFVGIKNGIASVAQYSFYAAITAVLSKLLKK